MVVTDGKMTVMLWKQFYGNYAQVRRGEMSQKNSVLGKQHLIALIAGLAKGCGRIFF